VVKSCGGYNQNFEPALIALIWGATWHPMIGHMSPLDSLVQTISAQSAFRVSSVCHVSCTEPATCHHVICQPVIHTSMCWICHCAMSLYELPRQFIQSMCQIRTCQLSVKMSNPDMCQLLVLPHHPAHIIMMSSLNLDMTLTVDFDFFFMFGKKFRTR
jgi:hypothetical protein